MDKSTKQLATSFICNGVILLENLEDLKHTNLWRQQIKYHGNRFFEELERVVLPVEAKLFEKDEEIKLVQEIQDVFEDVSHDIAKLDLTNLLELRAFIRDLIDGKVIKLTDKEAEKLKAKPKAKPKAKKPRAKKTNKVEK
jgi:hypothetical protein